MSRSLSAVRKRGSAAAGLPDPTTPQRAQTRQALLEAAERLFAERGYHETSVPAIVQAAGVSQGTFYQYFRDRRGILMALTQIAHDAAAARAPLRGGDLADAIRAEINWYLIESIRNTQLAKVWHDAAVYDHEIARIMRDARAARAAEISRVIKRTKSAEGLDPDIAATALVAMIEEFAYRWFVENSETPRNTADAVAASQTLSELVIRSLGRKNASHDRKVTDQ
jgi:AcrR family transcriptional regulator